MRSSAPWISMVVAANKLVRLEWNRMGTFWWVFTIEIFLADEMT